MVSQKVIKARALALFKNIASSEISQILGKPSSPAQKINQSGNFGMSRSTRKFKILGATIVKI